MTTMDKNSKVKFYYVPPGRSLPATQENDTIYFDAENNKLYVGTELIAADNPPQDLNNFVRINNAEVQGKIDITDTNGQVRIEKNSNENSLSFFEGTSTVLAKIKIGDPENDEDAATKQFVEEQISEVNERIDNIDIPELPDIDPNDYALYENGLTENGTKLNFRSFNESNSDPVVLSREEGEARLTLRQGGTTPTLVRLQIGNPIGIYDATTKEYVDNKIEEIDLSTKKTFIIAENLDLTQNNSVYCTLSGVTSWIELLGKIENKEEICLILDKGYLSNYIFDSSNQTINFFEDGNKITIRRNGNLIQATFIKTEGDYTKLERWQGIENAGKWLQVDSQGEIKPQHFPFLYSTLVYYDGDYYLDPGVYYIYDKMQENVNEKYTCVLIDQYGQTFLMGQPPQSRDGTVTFWGYGNNSIDIITARGSYPTYRTSILIGEN